MHAGSLWTLNKSGTLFSLKQFRWQSYRWQSIWKSIIGITFLFLRICDSICYSNSFLYGILWNNNNAGLLRLRLILKVAIHNLHLGFFKAQHVLSSFSLSLSPPLLLMVERLIAFPSSSLHSASLKTIQGPRRVCICVWERVRDWGGGVRMWVGSSLEDCPSPNSSW